MPIWCLSETSSKLRASNLFSTLRRPYLGRFIGSNYRWTIVDKGQIDDHGRLHRRSVSTRWCHGFVTGNQSGIDFNGWCCRVSHRLLLLLLLFSLQFGFLLWACWSGTARGEIRATLENGNGSNRFPCNQLQWMRNVTRFICLLVFFPKKSIFVSFFLLYFIIMIHHSTIVFVDFYQIKGRPLIYPFFFYLETLFDCCWHYFTTTFSGRSQLCGPRFQPLLLHQSRHGTSQSLSFS